MSFALTLLLLIGPLPTSHESGNPTPLADLSEQALIEQAGTAFTEGVRLRDDAGKARPLFRQAARLLEELCRRGVNNPQLHRNLGNAFLLADDLPRAILTYRQGLRLAPDDRELSRCLEEARELVIYPPGASLGRPRPDERPAWLAWVQPRWLYPVAVVLYVAAWVALGRWLALGRAFPLRLGLGLLLGAAGLTLTLLLVDRREKPEHSPLVVVADDGVLLRKGDDLNFPPRWETPVNKGVEARMLFERGDWLQIQLAGGEIGWVRRDMVLVDSQPETTAL
jgi:tetratricopeptide (TPR) repeat protein